MIQILPEHKQECCGCGACMQACPAKCISMVEDDEGFLYPQVDTKKCMECSRCQVVCPIKQESNVKVDRKNIPKALGGWHKNEKIRYQSSSGGAFTLFAEHILARGGVIYGCTLDENFCAMHISVECTEDLEKLRGSKYMQSDIGTSYQKIERQLKVGRIVFFIGTPCQAAGLCSFLGQRYENLYVCDFICHGVPSPKVFRGYIDYLEQKYHDRVIKFQFRCKDTGWDDTGRQTGTRIQFLHIGSKRFSPYYRDAYMKGFLDDLFLRPSCYVCSFKQLPKYYADITVADFWGVKDVEPNLYDGKGTSLVLLNNIHGERLFESVRENFFYMECEFKDAVRCNPTLNESVKCNPRRNDFFKDYKSYTFRVIKRKYLGRIASFMNKLVKTAGAIDRNKKDISFF